jgi:hypothetical protein
MYAYEITEASRSALLELSISLKRYHDDIVLTGGWAPYFISKDHFEHCGSIDIDLALRTKVMPKYDTIRKTVEDLGYRPLSNFRFSKKVKSPVDGKEYDIHLDFLCDKEGLVFVDLRKVQEDLDAFAFEGLGLAFDLNFEQYVETVLPGDGMAETTFKVISLPGSLALKGQALNGRAKPKDSYDIFALTHYKGGPVQAAEHFNKSITVAKLSPVNRELLMRSIGYVRSGFRDASRRGPLFKRTYGKTRHHKPKHNKSNRIGENNNSPNFYVLLVYPSKNQVINSRLYGEFTIWVEQSR